MMAQYGTGPRRANRPLPLLLLLGIISGRHSETGAAGAAGLVD